MLPRSQGMYMWNIKATGPAVERYWPKLKFVANANTHTYMIVHTCRQKNNIPLTFDTGGIKLYFWEKRHDQWKVSGAFLSDYNLFWFLTILTWVATEPLKHDTKMIDVLKIWTVRPMTSVWKFRTFTVVPMPLVTNVVCLIVWFDSFCPINNLSVI